MADRMNHNQIIIWELIKIQILWYPIPFSWKPPGAYFCTACMVTDLDWASAKGKGYAYTHKPMLMTLKHTHLTFTSCVKHIINSLDDLHKYFHTWNCWSIRRVVHGSLVMDKMHSLHSALCEIYRLSTQLSMYNFPFGKILASLHSAIWPYDNQPNVADFIDWACMATLILTRFIAEYPAE